MKSRAVIIAGTQSGSGKTTITLGIMAALRKLGHKVMPFKCGPDFIDPSLHHLVTGTTSRNLDLWMAGQEYSRMCFYKHASQADISIIEGVMGMFDGGTSSSAALASELKIPVILVLDVRSTAESAAAVLKGFESLDPTVNLKGVILNMVGSERHLALVSQAIEKHCRSEILGYLPRTLDFSIPSRHLGLHMGEESPLSPAKMDMLAQAVLDHIDIEKLLRISDTQLQPEIDEPIFDRDIEKGVRLAVARDRAFCFYYEDNLDIFRAAGAEICFFSPLTNDHLPDNIDGIYLGGGYPELHGALLSSNTTMLQDIRNWAENGKPIYAECGGFMYLTRGITDTDGKFHPLASVFPTDAVMGKKRASLGYRELAVKAPCFFGPAGTILRGHEFHYSHISEMDSGIEHIYLVNNSTSEGYRYKNVVGGYMHLHFGFNPQAAAQFIQFCKEV